MVNNDDEGGSSAPVGIPVEEAIIPSAAVAGETTASPSWKGKRSNDNTSADEATTTLDSKKPRLESDQKKDSKAAKAVDDWNDDMKWVCAECKEAECLIEPSADQFLLCDGHCHRIFHYPCAGLSQIPAEEEDFICKDCSQSRHQCAFCQDYGQDHVDVFACRKDNCGLFFHESCLALNNVPVKMMMTTTTMTMMEQQGIMERTTTRSPTSVEADPPQLLGSETLATTTTSVPVFVCPAHHCWTCTQDDALQKEREQQQQQQQQQQDAKRKEAAGKNGKNKKRGTKSKQTSIFQCKTEGRIYVSEFVPAAVAVVLDFLLLLLLLLLATYQQTYTPSLLQISAMLVLSMGLSFDLLTPDEQISRVGHSLPRSLPDPKTSRSGSCQFVAEYGGRQD